MNFKKQLFPLLLLVLTSACGVKGDPITPKEPPFPSLLENYPDIKVDKPLNETRKK